MFKDVLLLFIMIFIPTIEAAVPGTFFWKPRLGLTLNVPRSDWPSRRALAKPTLDNLMAGNVVLIHGYQAGITVMALAAAFDMATKYNHHDPRSAFFYTNVYRWTLRHLSLLPDWFGGKSGHYVETHKLWKKRFFYMDKFVPQWLRNVLFFVDKKDWEKEERQYFHLYKKYGEPSFGKYYHYPNKVFNNYASIFIWETVEGLDSYGLHPGNYGTNEQRR